ncbi:MAG: ATP-binding protein [Firmicutes bacterium]|nr:ATP-binding protein [Bacillota bacterium]
MIKRVLFGELKKHLSKKEITFVAGPRQAGKTTLMFLLKDYLDKNGEKTVFLNLDIESDKQFFTSQGTLIKKIQLEIGRGKGYAFIDEIQRKKDAGLFLKGIYDMNLPYKFIVSGSGSVELKEKIHESLAGRKTIFGLNTLSFEEFVNFKTGYRYENKLQDFFPIDKETTKGLLEEYLNYGGYPRVVLEDEFKQKKTIINEIYQSYLEKDIFYLLEIKKSEVFNNLVKVIASQIGGLTNLSDISSNLGTSLSTIKNYLWYMEKSFVLQKVTPYFKNLRKEITKAPIYYFYDLGLRNHALDMFGNIKMSEDFSFLFENLVLNIIKEKLRFSAAKINFWRTKDGAEVDFIVDSGRKLIPIEVKYKSLRKPEIKRSLKSFISKYTPQKALIINLELEEKIRFEDTEIQFIPFYRLLSFTF